LKKVTPMRRQYLELKKQYSDCLLLFRLGDFYELFNEDAKIASKVLDIVLTARGEGVDKWPMCGVPYHAIDGYAAKLLQAGYTVAIAEQTEDASKAKGLVRREIVRLLTPGTVIEISMLDDSANNYLAALVEHDNKVGFATVDISSGQFMVTQFKGNLTDEQTLNELSRFNPSEILLQDSLSDERRIISEYTAIGARLTFRNDIDFSARTAEQRIKEIFKVSTIDGFGLGDRKVALGAVGAVIAYLQEVYKTNSITITNLRTYNIQEYMVIDATTQRNLELVRNARDNSTRGTLLSVLSKTVTPMGRRKLKQWLLQPLTNIIEINQRLDSVEELAQNAILRRDLIESIREIGDLERITSRIVFGTAGARELLALSNTLGRLPKVQSLLKTFKSDLIKASNNSINPLPELHKTLKVAIVENPPITVREGGMIRTGFDDRLDKLKETIAEDKKWIASLQVQERRRTGIKTLKVGYNKVFGYYIEITKANLKLVPPEYDRKQTLTSAERFITPELKEKEARVLSGEEKINQLEYEIFESLRDKVSELTEKLHRNSSSIAAVDVLTALAEIAVAYRYTRPKITDKSRIRIIDGRHPSMEQILGPNEFVPNSLDIGDGNTTLIIVTGPNMAGKSTYMRQAALIVLMAQMGSFVPAKSAEIGLVDRIFTRVGAFDDLTARQSTFMVEMIETANILHNATEKSLVVLDEIGRGTSTFDGMALAWAVAERIVLMKTRTLFATHFHQLTEMADSYHGVKNVHTLAKESGDTIVFLHKVVDGGTDKSYGVHVAALAGVPETVVRRAKQLLVRLEKDHVVDIGEATSEIEEPVQTSLEALTVDDPLIEKLSLMDLERLTPIEALLKLKEFQDEIRKREKSL
jgi:DNA mismatch repair protein MutS